MKATDLRSKSDAELGKELLDLRRAQLSLRVQLATQQNNNTSQIGRLRKDIARVKTVQHERVAKNDTRN
jgi:large subunit ribosomal protein L29